MLIVHSRGVVASIRMGATGVTAHGGMRSANRGVILNVEAESSLKLLTRRRIPSHLTIDSNTKK